MKLFLFQIFDCNPPAIILAVLGLFQQHLILHWLSQEIIVSSLLKLGVANELTCN